MQKQAITKTSKIVISLYLSIFIFIGLFFTVNGCLPIKIKINNIDNVATAQIHRKSILPPFKDVNINMPNVKLAVVTSSRSSKGGATYRVELEAYNGQRFPITNYYSSGYTSKAKLQDKINSAIQNKSDFDYIVRQPFMIVFGLIFMLIPSIMFFSIIKGTTQLTCKRNTSSMPTPISNKPESEKEKYHNINDSIIK